MLEHFRRFNIILMKSSNTYEECGKFRKIRIDCLHLPRPWLSQLPQTDGTDRLLGWADETQRPLNKGEKIGEGVLPRGASYHTPRTVQCFQKLLRMPMTTWGPPKEQPAYVTGARQQHSLFSHTAFRTLGCHIPNKTIHNGRALRSIPPTKLQILEEDEPTDTRVVEESLKFQQWWNFVVK